MAHHKADLRLCVTAEIYSFGDTPAYHFMVVFTASFLVRCTWVTIEQAGSLIFLLIEFNCFGIGKLTAVVCKQYREQFNENIRPELKIQFFKYIKDRLVIIGWP